MKLICISGLHHLILITFFVDSISEATKKYYETRERGAGAPPPALVPVLSISKTCLLGHPKVTNFYSCNIIFDVIFSVANPFFLQFPRTQCSLCRCHPVKTHVRTLIIIEVNGCSHSSFHSFDITELHAHK